MLRARLLLVLAVCFLALAIYSELKPFIAKRAGKPSPEMITTRELAVPSLKEEAAVSSDRPFKKKIVGKRIKKKPVSLPEEKPAKPKKLAAKKPSPLRFFYEVTTKYNDNVYGYSSDSIANYKDYQERDTRFRHVRSLSDIVTRVDLELSRRFFWLKDLASVLGVGTRYDVYLYNTIKDEFVYSFFFRQYLSKKTSLELAYDYDPRHFIKYLLDKDIPTTSDDRFAQCYYRRHTIDAILRHDLRKDLALRFRYRFELDLYNGSFRERDAKDNSFRFDIIKYWLKKNVRASLFYDMLFSDARGEDDDPGGDVDNSYNNFKLGATFEAPVYKDIRVQTGYWYAYRPYTSKNSLDDDPLHRDRLDRIQNASIKFFKPISKNTEIFVGYEYEFRDPTLKASDADLESEPYVGYKRNIGMVGIRGVF